MIENKINKMLYLSLDIQETKLNHPQDTGKINTKGTEIIAEKSKS